MEMVMDQSPQHNQTDESIAKNISFFLEHRHDYDKNIQELDTYAAIRASINQALYGIDRLLDIGNGGVFDYDTNVVSNIIGLDLFFDNLPSSYICPSNVTLKTGSALNIPEVDGSFDSVLMVMLIHHLVGKTVRDSLDNMHRAIQEAFRVLRPGGRLIIVESCVPQWFYMLEKSVFSLTSPLINNILSHPATLQYTVSTIENVIMKYSKSVDILCIPKGRWVLQYGFKFPAALTPVNPYRFVAYK
jgi:SAM-dependent methyltransferase